MAGADDISGPDALPPVLARLLPRLGGIGVVDRLSSLSGSDFTSLMLEVARRRAAKETPATVLRRYTRDRFVRPGTVSWWSLRRAEDLLLSCLPAGTELLVPAPLVPLGTHSVLGNISQDRVVTAMRACEVAADATNALALEAATRRAHTKDGIVRLAAVQRVVRAQPVDGARSFAHFSLFGLVTAGRDQGNCRFERHAVAEHLRCVVSGLAAAGRPEIQVALTPLSDPGARIAALVTADLSPDPVDVVTDPERATGRGYYRDLCFKINARVDGEPAEFADGGFTDWVMRLTADNKERLLISGLGIDRLALSLGPP
jgi:hypothetical protein